MRGMGMAFEGYGNGLRGVWKWHLRGMRKAYEGYGNGI